MNHRRIIVVAIMLLFSIAAVSCRRSDLSLIRQGNTLGKAGQYEQALEKYDKALQLNPRSARAWLGKSTCLKKLKRNDEAMAAVDEAVKIDASYTEAWYNKGLLYNESHRSEDALMSFNRALAINPNWEIALYSKSTTLTTMERYDEAQETIGEAIGLNGKVGLFFYQRAVVRMKKNADGVLADLEQAVKLDSTLMKRAAQDSVFQSLAADPSFQKLITR